MRQRTALMLGYLAMAIAMFAALLGLHALGASEQLVAFVGLLVACAGAVGLSLITLHFPTDRRD